MSYSGQYYRPGGEPKHYVVRDHKIEAVIESLLRRITQLEEASHGNPRGRPWAPLRTNRPQRQWAPLNPPVTDPSVASAAAAAESKTHIEATGGLVHGTDGDPPASSPTPTLDGSLGVLVAKWTPVTNDDLVLYDVHLSTTTGFTPDGTTLVASTPGASFVFRKTAAGAALAYGTTYHCKIIATDADGDAAASAQASATLAQVAAADITANTITANEIATGAISTDELAASSVTAGKMNVSTLSAITADLGTVTAGSYQTAGSGTYWKISSTSNDLIQGFLSGIANPSLFQVSAAGGTRRLNIHSPYDTGDLATVQLQLDAGVLESGQVVRFGAGEQELLAGFQGRGFCAVIAYNDNAGARSFGHGVMYGGVTKLANVPSSITFTTVGTDTNISSGPTAGDIGIRGFRFQADINATAAGRASRTYVTVGN